MGGSAAVRRGCEGQAVVAEAWRFGVEEGMVAAGHPDVLPGALGWEH
jgi:hypothetical protein